MAEFEWIDLGNGRQVLRCVQKVVDKRSALPAPMVIGDTMPETQHPVSGQYYTSKARFRAETRARGCVEVGNDPGRFAPPRKPRPTREEVRGSVEKAKSEYNLGRRAKKV